jgi:hypothetical protein
VTPGGARGTIMEVVSESVKDGQVDETSCVRPCDPCFAIFILLDPRGIVLI